MKKIYHVIALVLLTLPAFAQIRPQQSQQQPTFKVNGLDLDYFNPREIGCINGEVYFIIFNTVFLIPASCLIQFLFNTILFNRPISNRE
ncbi:MAG: hypothetical protein EOO89_04440 [Pedobacter sp.]|nr:MAG: hypothetical protein EOO89_04440 [Pedobacter sp.]